MSPVAPEKVDGASQPADWVVDSSEKTGMADNLKMPIDLLLQ